MPLHYPSWRQVPPEQKAGVMARTKIGIESSTTREYRSLIRTFTWDEDRAIYEEMLRLQALGSNTPSSVPYTKEEINALARKGKQRVHLLDVGRVLPRLATNVLIPPPPPRLNARTTQAMSKSSKKEQVPNQTGELDDEAF
ncbi:hypothetical protein Tco_0112648 [Tanacetum coccineum]